MSEPRDEPRAPDGRIKALLRDLAPQVLGALARRFRDFSDAEDAVQEALLAAATQWPRDGIPDEPRAWLLRVAARKLTDHVRAAAARRRRETLVVSLAPPEEQIALAPDESDHAANDDTLVLLFLCCHPSLSMPSAVALTLRAVGGLTTAEIARAFLVPEATMAQRISRAKSSIRASGVPLELPSDDEEHARRLAAVLQVLYLVFNEGYASSGGEELIRVDLSHEAIRLARLLRARLPDDPDVNALLALMLLTDARRDARAGADGAIIPLDEQDRSRWDRAMIAEGVELVERALASGAPGEYQLLAAIAALHDEAKSVEETDWRQILALYDLLLALRDNPIVALNRAVAAAMVHGPAVGLHILAALDSDPRVAGHYRLDAVRAHLFERAGDHAGAARCYRRAAGNTVSVPERNYLMARAARAEGRGVP